MKSDDICCCCLVNCCFKDINQVYNNNGKLENYGEMLSKTFNVSLRRKSICEGCIIKVRDAAAFKEQMVAADLTLISQSEQLAEDNDQEIFEVELDTQETNEAQPQEDTLENDHDCSLDSADDEECSEQNNEMVEIKVKVNDRGKYKNLSTPSVNKCCVPGCKNRGHHRLPKDPVRRNQWIAAIKLGSQNGYRTIKITSRICGAHFTPSDCAITPTFWQNYHKARNFLKRSAVPSIFCSNSAEEQPRSVKVNHLLSQEKAKLFKSQETPSSSSQETFLFDSTKLKTYAREKPQRVLKGPTKNTIQLISNSNLCIFRPHQNNTEYACYLCKETYTNIKNLRQHSETHKLSEFLKRIGALQGMSCRHVDISNLRCLCAYACEDLDGLTSHLTEKHEIKFQNGGHLLIPYKLENGYQCVICKKEFNTFYSLTTHMNRHSTNNVCDICGSAYFSRQYLRQHVKSKHRESTCRICLSKFPTASELAQHSIKVHKKISKREYQCNQCNLIFNYGYKLKNHMVLSHGMPDLKIDCVICGKKLKNESCLKIHKRSVHDKERRFQCTLCDLRFFTKFDRVRHEKTHLDKCLFSCDCCDTKFKSKDSLRRHMKKQHTVSI